MKTDLEQVLAIKDVRLDDMQWNGQTVPGYRAVTDGNRIFGVVSPGYAPIAHSTVLARVQEFLPEGTVENVYTRANFSRVVFNIKLPKVYELDGDSPIQTYVNLRNSLDGGWSIGLIVSPIRVICQNTFFLHFGEALISISERHIESGVAKFMSEIPLVTKVHNALEGQLMVAKELISLPCTTVKGQEFLKKLVEKKVLTRKVGEQAGELFAHPTRKEDEGRDFWRLMASTTDVLSRSLEEKGQLSTLNQVYKVGEAFSELVSVR